MSEKPLSAHFTTLFQSGQSALALEQLKTLCQSLPDAEAKVQAEARLQEPEVPWQKIVQLIEIELAKIDQAALKAYALAVGDNNIVLQNIIGSIINIGNIAAPKPLAHQLNPIPSIDLDTDCIGREAELAKLAHKLSISNKVALVKGLGGIGKTTLAQAFVTLHQEEYQHLVWVNQGEDLITAVALDASLAHSLNMPFEQGEDLNTRFTRLMQKLRVMPGPNLLVIDNATEKVAEREAFKLLPKAPNWKVLVTSRQDLPDFLVMELHPLKPEAALSLFRLHYDGGSDEEVMALLEEIGFHTLMIELIAKTLRRKQGALSVPQLLDFLKKRKLNQPELEETIWARHSGEESGVFQYLMGLYELADLSAEEVWVLQQFAVLPALQLKPDTLAEWLNKDAEELNEVLNDLADRGWLGILQDQYVVHPLVQEFVKYRAAPGVEELEELVEAMSEKMNQDDFTNPITDNFPWLVYSEKVAGYFEGVELLPERVAGLWNNLGLVIKDLGQYNQAAELLQAALDSNLQNFGSEHPDVAKLQSNMALVLQDLGQYERAAELLQTALNSDLHNFGPEHHTIANHQSNLATVFLDLGHYKRAKELFKAALDSDLRNFGPEHPKVAICHSNLGLVFKNLGQYERAAELMQTALDSDFQNFGPNHPSVATKQSNLAAVYKELNHYERATELMQAALKSTQRNFGSDHPDVANLQSGLAILLQDLEQYEMATELLQAALDSDLRNFGPDHPNSARSQSNLALLLRDLGQYERAVELMQAALDSDLRNFGLEHPSIAIRQNNLASIYFEMNQFEAATALWEQAKINIEKNLGVQHPYYKSVLESLDDVNQGLKNQQI